MKKLEYQKKWRLISKLNYFELSKTNNNNYKANKD